MAIEVYRAPPTRRLTVDDLNPELKRFRFVPNLPVSSRWLRAVARLVTSLAGPPKLGAGMRYEKCELGQGAKLHVFSPENSGNGSGLLWMHGGGMVIGSASVDYGSCIEIARELGMTVGSMDYRLAPEHKFPAAMDDCHKGWSWLVEHADRYGLDPARIAIGGQSAGGGLAASLVQRLHDEAGVQPAAQWLFCPMLDDRTAADRRLDRLRHFLWNNRANRYGWSAYLPQEPGAVSVPRYSSPARRRELAGLPPAWIGTGDLDLFYAEDRAYAEALDAAGVDCSLEVVRGAPHAFELVAGSTKVAKEYTQRARVWLQEQLAL